MKKILILILVLGLASAADAAINGVSLRVAGPYGDPGYVPVQADYYDVDKIWAIPCEYIWIGVYNPTDGTPGTNMQKGDLLLGTVEPSPEISWTGAYHDVCPTAGSGLS
jgi:hypothetical protein